MSSGSSLTSKLYDKIIKMLSKSLETFPLTSSTFYCIEAFAFVPQQILPRAIVTFLCNMSNKVLMVKLVFSKYERKAAIICQKLC
jgi:hypothetical protein